VSVQADALPDDPGLLKAMLIAERIESERLGQIIREFQRHRFGRQAESLPEGQLQLALEDAEQEVASGQAASEQKNPPERKARAARRRTNRGALPAHLPRIETVVDVTSTVCPCCAGMLHRIGEDVSERLDTDRRSSGCWWCGDRSMPAGRARKWSSRRWRRPD
jgi:transposase